jgi:hypothetical protein
MGDAASIKEAAGARMGHLGGWVSVLWRDSMRAKIVDRSDYIEAPDAVTNVELPGHQERQEQP